jgi:serine/threonine protein kinase
MSENWKQWQGQIVGDTFQLVEYLGESATSGDYLATTGDGAKAAVKLVMVDPSTAQARLVRWEIAATLSHPHLLRVVRSGRCELNGIDLLYVATEYAEENLAQVIPQRPLSADEVRQMLPDLLDALDYLHQNQLVHGALKPGNIMATGDQLKLSVDGVMRIGESATMVGRYDAPEVQREVSPASDIWSLGMTLVEVLTQRLPVWEPGGTLPLLPDNMPDQYRVIVQRCLLHDPGLRCKIADFRERLNSPTQPSINLPAAAKTSAASAPATGSAKRLVVPIAMATVIIAAIVAIPRLFPPTPSTENSVTVETPPSDATPRPVTQPPAVMSEATQPQPVVQSPPAQESTALPTPIPVIVQQKASVPTVQERASVTAPKPAATVPAKHQPETLGSAGDQGSVVRQVLPDVPRKAMNTISGKFRVQVKVRVDREGNVVQAEFISRGPSKYFADLTMQAAREWKFSPSELTARAWNLQFEFRRSGASVVPTRVQR